MKAQITILMLCLLAVTASAQEYEMEAFDSSVVSTDYGMRRLDVVIGAVPKNTTVWRYRFTTSRREVIYLSAHWWSRVNYDLELWKDGVRLATSRNPGTIHEDIVYPRAPAGTYTVRAVRRGTYLPTDAIEVMVEYAIRSF